MAARLHSVSLGTAYILVVLFGVALSLRTRRRKITGRHLAARLHSVSLGNAYILLVLLGVALSLRTRRGKNYQTSFGSSVVGLLESTCSEGRQLLIRSNRQGMQGAAIDCWHSFV